MRQVAAEVSVEARIVVLKIGSFTGRMAPDIARQIAMFLWLRAREAELDERYGHRAERSAGPASSCGNAWDELDYHFDLGGEA